ncbi:MAG: hypothetical protein J6T10_22605 [Methanobrevibacter sp.]|nr:hypothetical protein [Methanobrevibacter sp.]
MNEFLLGTIQLDVEEQNSEIDFSVENETELEMELKDKGVDIVDNYELLRNLPKLNGQTIIGNMEEIDPTVPGWAKNDTKPSYVYSEVGAVGEENELNLTEIDRLFNAVFGI